MVGPTLVDGIDQHTRETVVRNATNDNIGKNDNQEKQWRYIEDWHAIATSNCDWTAICITEYNRPNFVMITLHHRQLKHRRERLLSLRFRHRFVTYLQHSLSPTTMSRKLLPTPSP